MVEHIVLGLSVVINIMLLWSVVNLLNKIEKFEDANESLVVYFDQLQSGLRNVLQQIKDVDIRGSFEADDEVGIVFKGIKGMVESLKGFVQESNAS